MKEIKVYSEIGVLKEVLVHTPGKEIEYVSPSRLDELLFSAILEPNSAREEHRRFIKILEDEGIKVVQLVDLVSKTYDEVSTKEKKDFMDRFLDEAKPKLNPTNRALVREYLLAQDGTKEMIRKMMSGILKKEIAGIKTKNVLVVDPMPNLYFTRDPFASVGNGVTIHKMKYKTRCRETIFADFIFSKNSAYKSVPTYYARNEKFTVEGGDVFIYNSSTLVIGVSERTEMSAIKKIAKNIKDNKKCKFTKIVAINVPPMPNLMHLDTWLTYIDYDKFLYSPNMMSVLKIWDIDLTQKDIKPVEINESLEAVLESIIGKKPILIPVAGQDGTQLEIDIETNFDATNFLTIRPGVVVGYSRNYKTIEALRKAGVTVLDFEGNQLSLGMGSARCMSMPLVREEIEE